MSRNRDVERAVGGAHAIGLFVSRDLLVNNQYKKRLMAAIYHRAGRTWFFKMVGEDATVLSAKPAFMQFLKSLKFNEN